MIKKAEKTKYVCSNCGYTYPKELGMCTSCGQWNTFVKEIIKPKVYVIPKVSQKVLANPKVVNVELENWFLKIADKIDKNPNCQLCGEFIPKKYYRHATAHILPKSTFPSVSCHEDNYLILGAGCGCHSEMEDFENLFNSRMSTLAISKLKRIIPFVKEKHKTLDVVLTKINIVCVQKKMINH